MLSRSLSTEVQYVKGIGPRNAKSLNKAGLFTTGDLLFYLPRRYEDRRHLPPIGQVRPGQFATVRGEIVSVDTRPTGKGLVIIRAVLRDATGSISLTWFNQPWVAAQLNGHDGDCVAYGMVKETARSLEITGPEFELIDAEDDPNDFARIVPIYPLREGLFQRTVRKAVLGAVEYYVDLVEDPLSIRIRREEKLPDLQWAIRQIHQPNSEDDRLNARRRLVFDEFFAMQVALAMRRAETQQELGIAFPIDALIRGEAVEFAPPKAVVKPGSVLELRDADLFEEEQREKRAVEPLWDQIRRLLPFELTSAQRRVIEEIWSDMRAPHPMNRLVQGDVGSGKTAVAACAMVAAVRSGYQAAMMAPTEILAEQHYVNLHRLLEPLGIQVELVVGKLTARDKEKVRRRIESGETHIAVGTNALIQEGVNFSRLGFVVIDEQHRFGVLQRAALREKSVVNPDVLVMTATPIPRTLTMTMYGDLEVSIIDELPPGRKPIKTHHKAPTERSSVYEAVRKLLKEGRQAYFVCPMVGESEKINARAAEELHELLKLEVFPEYRVALLHGQMRPSEKEQVMLAFRRHEYDVLVSTTVIEVGVDVPNSSIMVVEDANRFGLSQLHQLRGRVGRGQYQSYCVLIADTRGEDARARMEVMVQTSDGFRIAEEDLRLRGPGEIAGTKQSGNLDFKIADLVQDAKLLEVARQAAMRLIERDPQLTDPENQRLLVRVQERRSIMATITVS